MDLATPADALSPTLDSAVLSVLAQTSRPLTGREVHRLATRGSQSGVQRVLNRMSTAGLVDVLEAGSAKLYTLNREHVAAEVAYGIVSLRGQLFSRIRGAIASWAIQPVAAAVFGSAARGDGDTSSDIDIFLVRPDGVDAEDSEWADAVDDLAGKVRRWSGNSASVIQPAMAQVAQMIARNEPIVAELRRDAIPLTARHVLDVARVS